jgi:hypothetical protein
MRLLEVRSVRSDFHFLRGSEEEFLYQLQFECLSQFIY